MKLVKRDDGWWITEIPDCGDCGSYPSKAEAEEDRRGLQRTFDNIDNWKFWTTEKKQ